MLDIITSIEDKKEDNKDNKDKKEDNKDNKDKKEDNKDNKDNKVNKDKKEDNKDNNFKDKIYDYCLEFIKKDEVKKELKNLFKPIISLILEEIYPYIYLSLLLVIISFFLVLGIFIMLIKSYK
jgi:hypothetical protein